MARVPAGLEFDRSVAVLVVKIGHYPLHQGGVAAIRTLGRVGVPVYAITESRFTPAAVSRYLRGRFVWPTDGSEDPRALVEGLLAIGRRIDGRVIALATDDEAAVLLAEHADALGDRFLVPDVPPTLPRALSDKFALHQLCVAHGVPSPVSDRPTSVDGLLSAAQQIGYPVVLKNAEPWARLRLPAVSSTTVVSSEESLRTLTATWRAMPQVLVQEYLARGDGPVDWMADTYRDASGCGLTFTGVKVRSWPAGAGVATRAYAAANDEVEDLTNTFCRNLGYRGIADLDWRLDPVDGRYKLVDFNPRVGAQFRLFETEASVDVVRALHLDLTGRPIPTGEQVQGRGLRVENLDLPALWAHRAQRVPVPRGHTELAWLAVDDPLPAATAVAFSAQAAVAMLGRGLRRRRKQPVDDGVGIAVEELPID